MNLVEGNNELNVAMTPIGVVVPQIVSASWEVGREIGLWLVRGRVTISSPREFAGSIVLSFPTPIISGLDWPINYAGGWGDLSNPYVLARLRTGLISKSWSANIPAGQSGFDFGFIVKPDEAIYTSEWSRITYYSGLYQLSPTVSLYEGANLLDSVVYENAIRFTIGEEWPISVSIPAQIASGEDIPVGHTVHLAYGADYEYSIDLTLKPAYGRRSIGADYVGTNWYSKMQSFNPRADRYLLGVTGDYTFSGTFAGIGQSGPPSQRVPLPPGIYHLLSTCWLRSIASFVISPTGGSAATDYSWERQCWKDKDMGTVEII